jgi:hypothetical protein
VENSGRDKSKLSNLSDDANSASGDVEEMKRHAVADTAAETTMLIGGTHAEIAPKCFTKCFNRIHDRNCGSALHRAFVDQILAKNRHCSVSRHCSGTDWPAGHAGERRRRG